MLFSHHLADEIRLVGSEVLTQFAGELGDLIHRYVINQALDAGIDNGNLLRQVEGAELGLLQQFTQTLTAAQLGLGGGIQVGSELGEGCQFVKLGQFQFQGTSDFLDGLGLGGTTNPADRNTHIDGRTQTRIEEVRAEEYLTIRDRNHVGRDISGDVTGLGFNNWQGGHAALTHGVGKLGCPFQQAAVAIKNVTGIGLATWGTAQQQRHLAIGLGLFGEIVIDNKGGLALVHKRLSNGGPCIGS